MGQAKEKRIVEPDEFGGYVPRAVYEARRRLADVRSREEASEVLSKLVHELGGRIVRKGESQLDVVPSDLTLGLREGLYATAEPGSAAKWLLDKHLPATITDARKIVAAVSRDVERARKAGLHPVTLLPAQRSMSRLLTRLEPGDALVILVLGDRVARPSDDEQIAFAHSLRQTLRATDYGGHYEGGFLAILRSPTESGIKKFVERLQLSWADDWDGDLDLHWGAAIIDEHGWRAAITAASEALDVNFMRIRQALSS